jgi:DNA polymerase/3'-5' exonuclease PolX
MKLQQAQSLAERIVETMLPYCERVAIGGSIRRQKAEVKDIEIVAIPKFGEPVDLFGDQNRNLLFDWAHQIEREDRIHWIKPGTDEVIRWRVKEDGKYWRGWVVKAEIKLDLFLTTPDTWGLTYLIRTGSADFNARVFGQEARRTGHSFRDGKLFDQFNQEVRCPEEIDIFNALGMVWLEPQDRC